MTHNGRLTYQQTIKDILDTEEHFQEIFDSAPIGMAIVDLAGQFIRVNAAFCKLIQFPAHRFSGRNLSEFLSLADRKRLKAAARALWSHKQLQTLEIQLTVSDGTAIPVMVYMVLVKGSSDRGSYYIGQIIDLTERKQYEEAIRHLAYHDHLTGLPNRIHFRDRLTLALAQARTNDEMLAVVFVDLDRFKEINDTLGHFHGDEVLKQVALRLRSVLRQSDAVARMGGDEFILLLPCIKSKESVSVITEKIIAAIEEPLVLEGEMFTISASIGVALFPDAAMDIDDLLHKADQNMYQAKQSKQEAQQSDTSE